MSQRAARRAPRLRGRRPARQLQPGGGRALRHPVGGQPSGAGARGLVRRAALRAVTATGRRCCRTRAELAQALGAVARRHRRGLPAGAPGRRAADADRRGHPVGGDLLADPAARRLPRARARDSRCGSSMRSTGSRSTSATWTWRWCSRSRRRRCRAWSSRASCRGSPCRSARRTSGGPPPPAEMLAAGLLHDTDATRLARLVRRRRRPEVARGRGTGVRGLQPAARRGARRAGRGALPARHRRRRPRAKGGWCSSPTRRSARSSATTSWPPPSLTRSARRRLGAFRDWLLSTAPAAVRPPSGSASGQDVAGLGAPGHPDLRAGRQIEVREFVMALLCRSSWPPAPSRWTTAVAPTNSSATTVASSALPAAGRLPLSCIRSSETTKVASSPGRSVLAAPRGTAKAPAGVSIEDAAAGRLGHPAGKDVRGAEELGDEAGPRRAVDLLRGADLLDAAAAHDDDAVGHREGLGLAVGDVDEGDAELALQVRQHRLHAHLEMGVERATAARRAAGSRAR